MKANIKFLLLICLLAACGKDNAQTNSQPDYSKDIVIGYWSNNDGMGGRVKFGTDKTYQTWVSSSSNYISTSWMVYELNGEVLKVKVPVDAYGETQFQFESCSITKETIKCSQSEFTHVLNNY